MQTELVTLNDTIVVSIEKEKPITIKWQQNLKKREANFKVYPYKIKDKDMGGVLFVENKLTNEIIGLNKSETGSDIISVIVTKEFQYGQNKNKTYRFLVYHDKSEKMFQHRFQNNSIFQEMMENLFSTLGIALNLQQIFTLIQNQGKAYLGDPLRNF